MNIAIIEDSKTVGHIISATLNSYGYQTSFFQSEAIDEQFFKSTNFDFIIMDTSLEHIDSKSFIKKVKAVSSEVYILAIQTKGDWKRRVEILNCGADDLVSYPFPMQEIMARIQAILRRPKVEPVTYIRIKDLLINPARREVSKENKKLNLRKREYSLLEYMARNRNRPISRSELLDHVWDYRRITESNTLDVHISNLRRNIGDSTIIKTVHGFGYLLNDGEEGLYEIDKGYEEVKPLPEL